MIVERYVNGKWMARSRDGRFYQQGDTREQAINNLRRLLNAVRGG